MLKRNILIIMADHELQQLLVDFCAACGIATVTADSVARVRTILQRRRVTEVITDELQGEWPHLVRVVQQAGAIPLTLWAVDEQDRRQAERLGIRFVNQNHLGLPALVKVQSNQQGRMRE